MEMVCLTQSVSSGLVCGDICKVRHIFPLLSLIELYFGLSGHSCQAEVPGWEGIGLPLVFKKWQVTLQLLVSAFGIIFPQCSYWVDCWLAHRVLEVWELAGILVAFWVLGH